jgi:SAM-dependent methyltransferase
MSASIPPEDVTRHNDEIQENKRLWERKPSLRKSYTVFHRLIARHLSNVPGGKVVELGSGIGNIKEVIPNCVRTDLFPNPWLDQVENAYALSFAKSSVSDLILFDVFHHLRYPGTALEEFHRVLVPNGRVLIFEPRVSILGAVVFGALHPEPIAAREEIKWTAPAGWKPEEVDYYAAQGNATRIFLRQELQEKLSDWKVVKTVQLSAISYVASGGYSKPALYPDFAYPLMRAIDHLADLCPPLFATRLLVVLEKR